MRKAIERHRQQLDRDPVGYLQRRARLYEDPRQASVDEIVERLRRGVSGRTRAVAVTWVHSTTGVMLPLREIASALPERVLVCVDGVHGLGVDASTVRELRCDAFAAGCHKWLYGPRGTGRCLTPGGFHSFEHRWALAEASGRRGSQACSASYRRKRAAVRAALRSARPGLVNTTADIDAAVRAVSAL